jgi:thioredoxin reductase
MYDAIIVGGGFAGLAAALPLARARRRVLVVDAGDPRNRYAGHVHNFLGHDGREPAAIRAQARRQLAAYPTVAFADGAAVAARREGDGFVLDIDSGGGRRREGGRRLVLATGVRDELPPLPGLWERWGETVVHCPYCHGYELAGKPLGVLGGAGDANAMAAHKAALLPDWGPTILFAQGGAEPDGEGAALLAARGVTIEHTPVVALLGEAPALDGVRLADGRTIALGGLFVAPRTRPASALAEQLGCVFDEGPFGPYVRVSEFKETTVPGVFAAGDVATAMHAAPLAAAAGMLAGVGAHRSLVLG